MCFLGCPLSHFIADIIYEWFLGDVGGGDCVLGDGAGIVE